MFLLQAERRPPRQVALDGLGAGLLFSPRAPGPARRFPSRRRENLRGGAELGQKGVYRAPGGVGHPVVRGGSRACPCGDDLRGVRAGAGEICCLFDLVSPYRSRLVLSCLVFDSLDRLHV